MQRQKEYYLKQSVAVFTYFFTLCFIFTAGFMLLRFPEDAGRGVTNGIDLCIETLIPSMFPFMFLSTFIINSGIINRLERTVGPLTQKVFRLPGICAAVIAFSMTGGLPIGPKMTSDLYSKGYITALQGRRMLFFCMNPGPAFVISAVGHYMLGSEKIGVILYTSVVLSSLLIGFFSARVCEDCFNITVNADTAKVKAELHTALQQSVVQSCRSMLTVCAWVILFSCFIELVAILPLTDGTKAFLYATLEMTNGCKVLSASFPVPLLAGIIGFGGICAHMQVMSSVLKLRLKVKYFICARVLNGGLSVLISMFLLELFPVAAETFSMGTVPEKVENVFSLPICISVMVMCFLLLLGDNFRLNRVSDK